MYDGLACLHNNNDNNNYLYNASGTVCGVCASLWVLRSRKVNIQSSSSFVSSCSAFIQMEQIAWLLSHQKAKSSKICLSFQSFPWWKSETTPPWHWAMLSYTTSHSVTYIQSTLAVSQVRMSVWDFRVSARGLRTCTPAQEEEVLLLTGGQQSSKVNMMKP